MSLSIYTYLDDSYILMCVYIYIYTHTLTHSIQTALFLLYPFLKPVLVYLTSFSVTPPGYLMSNTAYLKLKS